MTAEATTAAKPRAGASAASLLVNVGLPLLLMGLAWKLDPLGYYESWRRTVAALLYVAPNVTAILFTTGYDPHARASGESPWVLLSANLVSTLGIVATIALDAFGIARMPGGEIVRDAGLIVFALGTALRVATMLALGRMFSLRVSVEPDHQLVTNGFYTHVRHPSYTSVIVLCLGIALVFRSWFYAALIPMMVFGLVRRMDVEERFLAEHFGEPYRAYMARTKRLVPGVY